MLAPVFHYFQLVPINVVIDNFSGRGPKLRARLQVVVDGSDDFAPALNSLLAVVEAKESISCWS